MHPATVEKYRGKETNGSIKHLKRRLTEEIRILCRNGTILVEKGIQFLSHTHFIKKYENVQHDNRDSYDGKRFGRYGIS
jgi:hypothetical protein